jgi:hypothetical protein
VVLGAILAAPEPGSLLRAAASQLRIIPSTASRINKLREIPFDSDVPATRAIGQPGKTNMKQAPRALLASDPALQSVVGTIDKFAMVRPELSQ